MVVTLPSRRPPIVTHLLMAVAQFKKGGRFAVVVPKCPKETHYLFMPVSPIQEGGGVSSCLIQEGDRFAAVVPNSLKETLLII